MKKKLNFLCVLMLLLMVAQVVMTFVMGADDFAKGWREGAQADTSHTTWPELLSMLLCFAVVIAAIGSFACFFRFILNVNRNEVFEWDNVLMLRLTGIGQLVMVLSISGFGLLNGHVFTEVYDEYFDILIFSVFNLIVAEAFAIGLKLKQEQDLTI